MYPPTPPCVRPQACAREGARPAGSTWRACRQKDISPTRSAAPAPGPSTAAKEQAMPDDTTTEMRPSEIRAHLIALDPNYERERYWAPFAEYPPPGKGGGDLDRQTGDRHAKVSEIIARGLERIRVEIEDLDPDLANIDHAG